jgi:hypothetical protein
MQEQQESVNSRISQSWQKMLATLLKLNRNALEARKEEEAQLKKQRKEAA